jgi:integrase/recombinase XerD
MPWGAPVQVNITKRIDTPEGTRYCPVVVGPNGRIKPDWVMVNDRQEKHPEGAYYLDWTEDGKRRRVSVGSDATAAYNSRVRKQRELDALASGLIVSNPIEDDSRLRIRSAIDDFFEEIQLGRQRKTWMGYRVSLQYFLESCGKSFLDDLERKDLLRFAAFLRDTKKLSPRTVHNKFADVLTFLQVQGVPKLIGKNDHPRFIEQEVAIYEDDELSTLHAVCSPYHSTLYDFFLMSGFREQEAMHVLWSNVRFNANIIEMRWKPQFNWTPKAYKEREVPVPDELLEILEAHRRSLPATRSSGQALVFSTASGKRDKHMLRALKRNARKAGVNPDDFWLHKFRATFATTHLQAGIDLRTVMTWMGQTNLESIIRYLKPARNRTVIEKVNSSFVSHNRSRLRLVAEIA